MKFIENFFLSPFSVFLQNRKLIFSLSRRNVQQRYQGSFLGLLWSVLTPIIMLVIYTFIFSVVFKSKWGGSSDKYQFAMLLFSGLIVFNLFSDIVSSSSSLIVSYSNYVTKVIFPVEILPWVITLSSLFNFMISFVIWLIFYIALIGIPSLSILLIPIVMIPFCLFCCGLSYIISSLGVYLRDINQLTSLIITALMFMTPIFYPISALPEQYRSYMYWNPVTNVIEMFRDVAIYDIRIQTYYYLTYFLSSLCVYLIGFWVFKKLRKGFSDVL